MLQLLQHRWCRWRGMGHPFVVRRLFRDSLGVSCARLPSCSHLSRVLRNGGRHAARWWPDRRLVHSGRQKGQRLGFSWRLHCHFARSLVWCGRKLDVLCWDARHLWHSLAKPAVGVAFDDESHGLRRCRQPQLRPPSGVHTPWRRRGRTPWWHIAVLVGI